MKKLRCTMNVCLISHQAQNGRFSNTGTLVSKFTEVRFHRTRIFSICYRILKYRRKVMFERLREIEIFSDIEKTMKTKSEIVKCVEQRGWMRGKKGCDIAYYYDYGNQYIFIFVYQSKNYR